MSSNNGTNRIFDQAMKSSASNPDLRGSSKAAAGRSGSNGSGTVKDLSSMRGENSLESLQPTTFGVNRGSKRNDDQGLVSTPNADASGSSWSRRSDQPASAASGSKIRAATNSKNEVTWAGVPVPISKPTAPKPSVSRPLFHSSLLVRTVH
ncbi:hypothetical protein BDY24DRAFT_2208 [Mrakia frigida]|uniref:uncharacterized protein n=1 Tax=Mrakia frigida TaxID=29902 RepID=UPI003FCC18FB